MSSIKKNLNLIIALLTLSLNPVLAQNDIKELRQELFEKHPLIKEISHKIEAQEAKTKSAKAPSDPKIGLEVKTNDYPLNFGSIGDFPNNLIGISASKELKVLGKLSLKEEVEKSEKEKLIQELGLTKLILQSNLKQAYFEIFFLDKSIEIYQKILKLLSTIEGSVNSKYTVGKGTQYDLIRVQLETTKVIEKLETLKKDRETIATEINALAIRPVNAKFNGSYLDVTANGLELGELKEEKILEISKANYPKLLAQGAVIDKAVSASKLAKREYIPDINLKGFYGIRDNSDFGSLFSIGLETSLPVFFSSKQRQEYIEAKKKLEAERQKYEDLEIQTLASSRKLFVQIEKSKVLTDILDDALLPQANLAVESSLATYKVGKTDFPSVLDSINDLLRFQVEYYSELSKGLKSIAVLEPLLGQEIGEFKND